MGKYVTMWVVVDEFGTACGDYLEKLSEAREQLKEIREWAKTCPDIADVNFTIERVRIWVD